jgi:hypothetical protein
MWDNESLAALIGTLPITPQRTDTPGSESRPPGRDNRHGWPPGRKEERAVVDRPGCSPPSLWHEFPRAPEGAAG